MILAAEPACDGGSMETMPTWLPALNTGLIAISGLAALTGYFCIRRRNITAHKWAMLTALTFAALFLLVYLTRAALYGGAHYAGHGLSRVVYFVILISHSILAAALGPLALVTAYRALTRQFRRHRRIARFTLPIWLYVAVTGWIIYVMLYGL